MNEISVNVNGKVYKKTIDSDMRLIDFLREELKLKGTKESCGEGECGACTVILEGEIVNSCLVLAADVDNSNITTIEGISENEMHPIQKAFIDAGAVQCGFCTPGMILSAKALLDKNPYASDAEIAEGISGNLCRCTGYTKIFEAIKLAQKYMNKGN